MMYVTLHSIDMLNDACGRTASTLTHLLRGLLMEKMKGDLGHDRMIFSVFEYFFNNPSNLNYDEWDVFLCACWYYMSKKKGTIHRPNHRNVILNGLATSVDIAICQKCKGNGERVTRFMQYASLYLHMFHKVQKNHGEHISDDEKKKYEISCDRLVNRTCVNPSISLYAFCDFPRVSILDTFTVLLHPKLDILVAVLNRFNFTANDIRGNIETPLEYLYHSFVCIAMENTDIVTDNMRRDVTDSIEYLYILPIQSDETLEEMKIFVSEIGMVNNDSD